MSAASIGPESGTARVSAGIVVFHPDGAHLARLVAAVAPDVREVVIFANSATDGELEALLREAAGAASLAMIRPGVNVGLGAAYQALAERARAGGDRFLFILDQDSLPEPGTIPRLTAVHDRLREDGLAPAIVGPRPYGPDGRPMKIAGVGPGARAGDATRVAFVISSGSLLDLAAAEAVGPFRADYFIDAIDLEWCFRATARGFSIWAAETVRMDHRLGRGVIRLPVLGLLLADQPPRRLYTFVRNQLAMLRLGHVPLRHKVTTLATLPVRAVVYLVRNGFSRECRAALRNGVADGIRNRLGPPNRAFAPIGGSRPAGGRG